MLSILFGLISAVTWGAADFAAGVASRKVSAFQVVAVTWFFGLIVMPLVALISGEPMMPLAGWLWCSAGGAFGITGILILYQMLSEGIMSTAVSISAVMAGALPVVAGIILEGMPGPLKIAGFVVALIAVWMITMGNDNSLQFRLREIGLPLLAGVGFGMYFILVNRGSEANVFWPLVATRLMGGVLLAVMMLVRKRVWIPTKTVLPILVLNFVLDTAGTIAFILAGQTGRLDVAAVLGSLYPAMTILLAWLLLRESMNRIQWVGICLSLGAIVLFSV